MSIELRICGTPAPQGSKTRTKWGMIESSKAVGPWREAVVGEIIRQGYHSLGLHGPLYVRATFLHQRPKNHYRTGKNSNELKDDAPVYVTKTPDLDKVLRSTFDALTQSGLIKDDSNIVIIHAQQIYAGISELPGAILEIGIHS